MHVPQLPSPPPLPEPLPLFPLQAVLFPDGLLPLKVFEARYVDLVTQCLREGTPFGVLCLLQGSEAGRSAEAVRMHDVGVLAVVQDMDAEQSGILRVSCKGMSRFRCTAAPHQQGNGLWVCSAEHIAADETHSPPAAQFATVEALSRAIASLRDQGLQPFAEPYRLDDAGWVANRWCELLPISLAAKQNLMALPDAAARLGLVDSYLRDMGVVV